MVFMNVPLISSAFLSEDIRLVSLCQNQMELSSNEYLSKSITMLYRVQKNLVENIISLPKFMWKRKSECVACCLEKSYSHKRSCWCSHISLSLTNQTNKQNTHRPHLFNYQRLFKRWNSRPDGREYSNRMNSFHAEYFPLWKLSFGYSGQWSCHRSDLSRVDSSPRSVADLGVVRSLRH